MNFEAGRIAIATLFVLASCENMAPGSEESATADVRPPFDGQAAYDSNCAPCHSEGVGGAPVAGDPVAWEGRSPLWMAVLGEHARDGYMQMPAQGEDKDVYDAEIQAATEYMLLLAYPDRPRD